MPPNKQSLSSAPASASIFDRMLIRQKRDRYAAKNAEYNFLHNWTAQQITDRLKDIKRTFPLGLIMGPRFDENIHVDIINTAGITKSVHMDLSYNIARTHCAHTAIQADEEFLPIKSDSLDIVLTILNLHTVNDLPGALIQINRALKPDGVFIGSMLGGETLYELRESFTQAEIKLKGGISPRVAPFADKKQMGALLQRAGYALPVVDSEIVTITYDNVFKLMHDLRYMAESNSITDRSKDYPGKELIMEAARYYQENFTAADGKIEATFEIIFLIGWAPHESQQQPLRPGSAQHRLADALSSEEIKTGIKSAP